MMNTEETHGGYYAPDPMPRWKRWLQQTFFAQTRIADEPDEVVGFAPGELSTTCVAQVGWADRLRLLVSGRFTLEMRHRVDVPVARIQSRSEFNVSPPASLR